MIQPCMVLDYMDCPAWVILAWAILCGQARMFNEFRQERLKSEKAASTYCPDFVDCQIYPGGFGSRSTPENDETTTYPVAGWQEIMLNYESVKEG